MWEHYLTPGELDQAGKDEMEQLLTAESEKVSKTITSNDVDPKVNSVQRVDPSDPTLVQRRD